MTVMSWLDQLEAADRRGAVGRAGIHSSGVCMCCICTYHLAKHDLTEKQ